jgi:hypothetical protein
LTEADCPRLAARASTLGNLLDEKAQAVCPSRFVFLPGRKKARCLSCVVLRLAAHDARSRSAVDAMESFYQLVEAEGRLQLLDLSQTEVNESLKRAEEMQAKDLHPAVEIAVIQKQGTDLRSDDVNVRIAILQLNARLNVLLGLSCSDSSLWPLADLKVAQEEIDVDDAVEYGLHHRPDITSLETIDCCMDAHSVAVASQALAAASPLLAEPPSSGCCASFFALFDVCKVCSTKQQIETLMADRRKQATEEIRQLAGEVTYRVQLVILDGHNVEREQQRIDELDEKRTKGLDVEQDLSTTKLNLYKARGEQLHEVVNWKIARAKFLHAQGRLLEECP